jgi:pimeloyl-ACP methyl ester carboxylesterase
MLKQLAFSAATGALAMTVLQPASAAAQTRQPGAAPTVVLVHGAFADSSGWNGVVERLQAAGVRVQAVSNPLRGIAIDSAYVASAIAQIPGPVIAVGHSYGGAVISNAASRADNVVGLVYVAAFAPDEGETLAQIEEGSKDSVLNTALLERKYPVGSGGAAGTEFLIKPESFHSAFAADLTARDAAVAAATQRPVSSLAFSERNGPPAWKRLPSWAVVPKGDKAAGSDVLRSMAKRAKASTTEVEGSHVIMISKPEAVTSVIMRAVESARARVGSLASR